MTLTLPGLRAREVSAEACSEWTFTARVVTIGAHPYEIEAEEYALFPAPAIRRVASPIPVGHGMLSPGPDYLGEQAIVVPVAIVSGNEVDAMRDMVALAADWAPADEPFDATVTTPIGSFLLRGKPDPLDVPNLGLVQSGIIRATARWWVSDPALRAATASKLGLELGASVVPSGHGFSHGFSHGFVPGSTKHTAWALNEGNFPAAWVASISPTEALVNPVLELVGTGLSLRCLITVPVGQHLIIDQAARTVWLSSDPVDLSGAADRSNTVDYPDNADWWALPPGSSQVRLSATSGAATATLTWHSSYLI